MDYFTYEKYKDGYLVSWPSDTAVKYNYTYRMLLSAVFKVTKHHEAYLMTRDNYQTIISLSLYDQLPDDDRYIPHEWKHVTGVTVFTEEHAEKLVDELDKIRMWALLLQ